MLSATKNPSQWPVHLRCFRLTTPFTIDFIVGASGRTRTCNLLIRSQKLYPIELPTPRGRILSPKRTHCSRSFPIFDVAPRRQSLNDECRNSNQSRMPTSDLVIRDSFVIGHSSFDIAPDGLSCPKQESASEIESRMHPDMRMHHSAIAEI